MPTSPLRRRLERVPARLAAIPLPRLRRVLLALYVATAFADAAGKALAANASVRALLAPVVHDSRAGEFAQAATPSGNFEIFRTASRHLLSAKDLYAEYPAEHSDRFKYSPTFALLFAPFAWMWWPLALFLWSALNAVLLFAAVERVLPPRAALVALALLHLEVLRAMQNAQSNALVAALIILAFAWLERRRAWRAAAAAVAGASIKLFPLAALTFAIPRRLTRRVALAATTVGGAALLLPLAVTSPSTLLAQYASWRAVEAHDASQRWFSVMELIARGTGADWPNWPIQLAGVVALVAPLALRRPRWDEPRFRLLYLVSTLLFVVLFNHQAERASYVIAFAGATIWYVSDMRGGWRRALYALSVVTVPLMSTLIPGEILRTPEALLLRLTLVTLAIWVAVQSELFAAAPPAAAAAASPPPSAARAGASSSSVFAGR